MSDHAKRVLEHFGLREQPFAATTDPAYFHAAPPFREALFRLWNHIDERQGIAVVLGNCGSGKTTLLRKMLSGLAEAGDAYKVALIDSPLPMWTSYDLIMTMNQRLGVTPAEFTFNGQMEALHRFLHEERGRITTLIIDDAQNLNKRGQLELMRLAQNLETSQHKLLNILLFAQLEWKEVLKAVPNFRQRINVTYSLAPLSLEDTWDLIAFRLRQAGAASPASVFNEEAVMLIHAFTGGRPRETVNVCRNAMLTAARIAQPVVDADVTLHTIDRTAAPNEAARRKIEALVEQWDREGRRGGTSPARKPETPMSEGQDRESSDSKSGGEEFGVQLGEETSGAATTRREDEERANQLLLRVAQDREKNTKAREEEDRSADE
ncbi:MAG: AAA family ATPase [Candidatus Hydrogenedentota bacterium]